MIPRKTLPKPEKPARLACSACGAETEAACDCGVAYVPAGERAAKAVADPANKNKSDVLLAEEIGVGRETVRRERQKTTSPHGEVEKRTGKDGKARQLPKKPTKKPTKKPKDDSNPLVAAWEKATLKTKQEFIRTYWTEIKKVRDPSSVMRHRPGPCGTSLGTVEFFDDEEQEETVGAE
jgi:hypothetical protein